MAEFANRLKRLFGGDAPQAQPPAKARVDLQIVKGTAWEQDVDWIVVPMDAEGPARMAAIEARGRAFAKIDPPTAEGIEAAYRAVLFAAHRNGIRSLAFPPLWASIPDCDESVALKNALDAVASFLSEVPSTPIERVVFAMG